MRQVALGAALRTALAAKPGLRAQTGIENKWQLSRCWNKNNTFIMISNACGCDACGCVYLYKHAHIHIHIEKQPHLALFKSGRTSKDLGSIGNATSKLVNMGAKLKIRRTTGFA